MWMHHLVRVSHFAKYATNRPLTVWKMLTNVQKFSIPQWWRKWKSIRYWHADLDHNQNLITSRGSPRCPCLPSLVDVRFRVRQLSCLQNDRMTDRSHNLRLVGGGNRLIVCPYEPHISAVVVLWSTHELIALFGSVSQAKPLDIMR